jgi:hypothetical protein
MPGNEALGSGEDNSMAISIDQGQALAIYVVAALAFLVASALRARSSDEWLGIAVSTLVMGIGVAISLAPSGDPDAPPSLMLTGFSCLYVGFLVGTRFDPLNPFVGIGGANKEDGEYRTKDEAVEILGRRGIDAWPGLLLGISIFLLAIFLVEFR